MPDALLRAWDWMEAQGHELENEHGYYLTPYADDRQLGVVFSPDSSTVGWLEPGAPGSERLVAIADISADGSLGAMWLDADDKVRFVALGSDGELWPLADDAVDFCRMLAVGYDEYTDFTFGDEPEDEEAVEAHAEFRAWVEAELGPVPDVWDAPDDDHGFVGWMEANRPA
ncbi:hypothetical protein GCM10027418_17170 [Mariniluteicoccus endophyticus]